MKHEHDRNAGAEMAGAHRGHGHRGGGHRGRRPFDYGELRLLLLAMIAEGPRHGYELMKAIEERMGGTYSPSPGVIYPTLSWLDDMGYAEVRPGASGRKSYSMTAEGKAFLEANRAAVDDLRNRSGGRGGRPDLPDRVLRGMENLKLALRLRLRRGDLGPEAVEEITRALDAAAASIERS